MTTYTAAKDDLLIWLAKYHRDRTSTSDSAMHIQRLIIAAQAHAELKPSAGVSDNYYGPGVSTEAVKVATRALSLAVPGVHFVYTDVRKALEAAAPLICAAKDADTATVIADNDETMAKIDRLRRSLELYRDDIHIMREREQNWIGERNVMRAEINALRHRDIDAAAERSFKIYSTTRRWADEPLPVKAWWRNIVRAVYGIKSEGE